MTGKERMIQILHLLQQQTNEGHQLSVAEITAYFTAMGVPTDHKTVKSDIETMIACGVNIVVTQEKLTKYFYDDWKFELAELKLLIDAVGASKFITERKAKELVRKLTSMTDSSDAGELKRQLYIAGRVKTENENIYYVVDVLYRAINQEQRVSFLYYEYNASRERVPRRGGEKYILSPYAMLYNEDKYYVLGYSESHEKIVTFRVDRMEVPKLLPDKIRPKPSDLDPAEYTVNVFSMYDGEPSTVQLICRNHLMNDIIDRFGDQVQTEIVDSEHFMAEVEASISKTFFGWVFQFTGEMKIAGPERVKTAYQQMLNQANESGEK